MTTNESTDSVHDEQFGKPENTESGDKGDKENPENENQEELTEEAQEKTGKDEKSTSAKKEKKKVEEPEDKEVKASMEEAETETPEIPEEDNAAGEAVTETEKPSEPAKEKAEESLNETPDSQEAVLEKTKEEGKEEASDTVKEEEEEEEEEAAEEKKPTEASEEKTEEPVAEKPGISEDQADGTSAVTEEKKEEVKEEAAGSEEKEGKDTESEKDAVTDEEQHEATPPKFVPEQIDYTKLSKEDLVKVLKDLLDAGKVNEIRRDVESIKTNFYKKHKTELDQKRKKFLTEGGQIQDFKVEESPVESELKELLNKYRDLRNEQNRQMEDEKVDNLKEKLNIIEGIKELINSQESLNKTFHDFRELQNRWREIGPIPQGNLKDLWESYHYHVEAFYDYIKINKELRDLDFKKNQEAKIKLCETAEELLLEPSVVEAFRKLQKLHDQWREIGPVPIEKRSELWERFKEATTKINRKHQEYFVNLKQEQKKNYEEKLILCEKAEEIAGTEIENRAQWEVKSKELIELQKVWKKIGFAPKKYNTQVYERFRKACDSFFEKKREHYSHNREEQQNNLQLKTELCIQAEALQDSTDWKKTTSELIAQQKKWKEIGPVPPKQSDKIWKRFRSACDTFFNNKSEFYSQIDSRYEENLEKKQKLIEDIEKFEVSSDVEKDLKTLNEYQRQWSEIGYVPLKEKNEIQEKYRQAVNIKFDLLNMDENKKSLLKYRNRLEGILSKPNSQHRLRMEREKCFNKLKQLENDITLWENNIGFFANSENAESMIQDVQEKIESAKSKIEQIKGKIHMLDEYED